MTTLDTPRLRLRRARATDLEALHVVFSDARAMQYWSTPPHVTLDETRTWLESMIAASPEVSDDFVIEHEGAVVGKAGFYRLPEVGYILRSDLWRRGLAREALTAVIAHVWATRDVMALHADVDPRNDASLALLARLGFVQTGAAERTWCVGGAWADSVYLTLERPAAALRGDRPSPGRPV